MDLEKLILRLKENDELLEKVEQVVQEFQERNMRGYVYIIYVGHNLYKIGKTVSLERRFSELNEERIVRVIKADNITRLEGKLHKRFSNKRLTDSQELFRLSDQDISYLHQLPDEWEDSSLKIF